MIKSIKLKEFLKKDVLGVIFLKTINILARIVLSIAIVRLFGLEFKGEFFEITSIAGIISFFIALSYGDYVLYLKNKFGIKKETNLFYPLVSISVIGIIYSSSLYFFNSISIYIGFVLAGLSEYYLFSILKAERKYHFISKFFVLKNIFILILVYIMSFNFKSYNDVYNLILLIQLILVFCFWIFNILKGRFHIRLNLRNFFYYSRYIHLNNVFNDIENKLDILIIIYFLSSEDLGVYSIVIIFAQAIFHFVNIINQIFSPILSKLSQFDKCNLVTLTSIASMFSTFLIFLLGDYLLELFYLITDQNVYYYLIILSTGVYFESVTKVLVNHIKLSNKYKSVGEIAVITAVLNLVLNIILIPIIGIYGAVITSFVTYLLRFICFYITYIKVFKIDTPFFAWSLRRLLNLLNKTNS